MINVVEPNWDEFRAKFSGRKQATFEWLCYLLFCKEHNKPMGIQRYINQAGIETEPIDTDKGKVGFQAKFYDDTTLAEHKKDFLKMVDSVKKRYPDVKSVYVYTHKDWGQGKGENKPTAKAEVDEKANENGITITWRGASYFESPHCFEGNQDIMEYFFTRDIYATKWSPAIRWSEWEKEIMGNGEFLSFEKADNFTGIIRGYAASSGKLIIRIRGLSGIGKTSMVFNAFASIDDDTLIDDVLYCNYNEADTPRVSELCRKLIRDKARHFLILDNCPADAFDNAVRIIGVDGHKTRLIGITSDNGENLERKDVQLIEIKQDDVRAVVKEIITQKCVGINSDKKAYMIRLSDGVPMMAVLFAQAYNADKSFEDAANDAALMNKLLGKDVDDEIRRILQTLSLFSYVGFKGEVREQLKFIADTEVLSQGTKVGKYEEIIKRFERRQIIEKSGRYLTVRPFPLAVFLAREWIETHEDEDGILELVRSVINREEMCRSFLDAFSNLNYSNEAANIVSDFVREHGPFDHAELLFSELGSRFFRSFADVNPVAVSKCLWRNVSAMDVKTRKDRITYGSRRNLVWTLEDLCFVKDTFNESAHTLLLLAEAENEPSLGNNATNILTQLFGYVSNTEADLKDKLLLMRQVMQDRNASHRLIGLKCMSSALRGPGVLWGNPGQQGLETHKRYMPKVWKEVEDYFIAVITLLHDTAKTGDGEVSTEAKKMIAVSCCSVCETAHLYGLQNVAKAMLNVFKAAIAIMDVDCKKIAQEELQKSVSLRAKRFDSDVLEELNSLLEALTPQTFEFQYEFYVKKGGFDDKDILEDKSGERIKEKFRAIAKQLSEKLGEVDYTLFYTGQQMSEYEFGGILYDTIKDDNGKVNTFVDTSIDAIKGISPENRRLALFTSFMQRANADKKQEVLGLFESDTALVPSLLYLLSNVKFDSGNMTLIAKGVKQGLINIEDLSARRHGCDAVSLSDVDDIKKSFEYFMEKGETGYKAVVDFMYTLSIWGSEKVRDLLPEWKCAVETLGVASLGNKHNDRTEMIRSVSVLLAALDTDEGAKFAEFVYKGIIAGFTPTGIYVTQDYITEVFEWLLKRYFDTVWPILKKDLVSADNKYYVYFSLKNLLGARVSTIVDDNGVLFKDESRYQTMIDSCHEKGYELLPARLAEMCPVLKFRYDDNAKDYDKVPVSASWRKFADMLIDECGDDKEVLNALSVNISNFSWKGDLSKYYELLQKLFEQKQSSQNFTVAQWAKDEIARLDDAIKSAKQRETEFNLKYG